MRYQSTRPKRQFLAGVKCTQCGATDTTVQVQIFEPMPDEYIECIQCNHTERRPSADDLSKIQSDNPNHDISVVRFIPK
ncbi:MAG: YheV family putative metal-binding protein [Moraxella sp.]|nr:YheV family putative metal-binding protein [Moraxella sp.]